VHDRIPSDTSRESKDHLKMFTWPLNGTLLYRQRPRLLRKTLELFAGAIPSFSTKTELNRYHWNTATVVSSPAFPANKGCSQASKLRSRGDLFRRCDASGQRQRSTKTPRRLGAHVWNWHLQPIRPEPARDPARKCPFVGVPAHFTRTHGATVQAELGADAKGR
jgi:hypothetical protein